ncbi:hypothetical protein DPMN_105056 [Dreissena polymorpha]|uniref:Uncharacterized protein n=1 Tax=Dreissena polymorpha TaxID=45954 RepID=A0A9D4K1K4_DREPO|nr:hypothetical protein DPMN_105056 [Dreissena polymorpha]
MNGIIGEIRVHSHIHKTNVLTKFHDDWTKIVTSRVPHPPGGHETNVLTKFHKDWAKNVSYRLFTCFHYIHIEKTAPPPGGHEKAPPGQHVFLPIRTIFDLYRRIQETYVLTKFHEQCDFYSVHIKLPRPPGGHVFSPIWTIFKLIGDINETNLLTKFHDDWANIVTSRVFTRNTAPPPGLHEDWASNVTSTVFTSFELSRGIIRTNVLTKFNEDQTINVASRVFTRQNVDDGRHTTDKKRSQKLTISTMCSVKRGVVVIWVYSVGGVFHDPSVLELSSDNHLVDGQTDRPT